MQAVTYYTEVSRAIEFSRKKLDEWYEIMTDQKSSRVVLTHGKVSARHFLYDDDGNGYLSNFEKSSYSSPIDDFLLFLNRTAKTYPIQSDDVVNWFYSYQKTTHLQKRKCFYLLVIWLIQSDYVVSLKTIQKREKEL